MTRQASNEDETFLEEEEEKVFTSEEEETLDEETVESQLRSLQEKLDQLLKENSSKDRKITELQRDREKNSQDYLTLESLQEQIKVERGARIRSEFALKNSVSGDLLEFLKGENEEELQEQWKNLKAIIEKKAKESLKENRQKLSSLPTSSQRSKGKEDLVTQIFTSQK